MTLEAARTLVAHTPLPLAVATELRRRARIRATHYSTRIEGNQLTLAEAEEALAGRHAHIQGRERDVREVRHYWHALIKVEEWAEAGARLTPQRIQRIHGMLERGPRARPTPWRDGQNVIREAGSGTIIYLPPEAKDVPTLIRELVGWVEEAEVEELPVPLIAGLAHYQLATIHPFYDGNGRTARLLATFLLHRGGYSLHGFFSLEEQHAQDLAAYYEALEVHPHHNYYEGRAEADLTGWLEYFIHSMAEVFTAAGDEALRSAGPGDGEVPKELRRLDARARRVMALFAGRDHITASDVAQELGLAARTVRDLLRGWVEEGWLEIADASRKGRSYRLSAAYRRFIGDFSATPRRSGTKGSLS
jgi:Fic family protein